MSGKGSINLVKDVFTTFEVARVCNANITSIKNWIEDGKIRAFRTPGGHYRIEKAVLIDFLNRYGMPNPFVTRSRKYVLVVTQDPSTVELIRRSLGREHEVEGTDDPIEAPLMIGDKKPDCLVIDLLMTGLDGIQLVTKMRENHNFNTVRIVAFTDTEDTELEHKALEDKKVNYFVRQSDGMERLNERVAQALI